MFKKMAKRLYDIESAIKTVSENVQKATHARPKTLPQITPRLVAVSKTKPVPEIITAYRCGQRHFGENYVKELEEKSKNEQILAECSDIKWHFIGHLQKNKANKVAVVPNLYMVETVDSQKLAQTLNNLWEKFSRPGKLKVMVQVNTSGEESKEGIEPGQVEHLCRFIKDKCPCLELAGLMTIGAYGYDLARGPNPDFLALVEQREKVCAALGMTPDQVELSMGMSSDYEHAILLGSTNIRVGSTIFGSRDTNPTEGGNPGETGVGPSNTDQSGASVEKGDQSETSNCGMNQSNQKSAEGNAQSSSNQTSETSMNKDSTQQPLNSLKDLSISH